MLVVSGSARPDGPVRTVIAHICAVAELAGADLRLADLAQDTLPLMAHGEAAQDRDPAVQRVRADAGWAQGFVLVTPEYHGNMSGALKNWFDFLYLQLAGKFAGVVTVTGGGGGDMSLTAVRNCFNWCHGFTLPYHAAARPSDFDQGQLGAPLRDRITRIVYDVSRYAKVMHAAFEAARAEGPALTSGVAGLHRDDPGAS